VLDNICLLGYYKYCDFFIDNINHVLNLSIPFKHIVLPLGISFFTFQQISFLHAVYTGELKKRYSFITYSIFVSFFPQLVAGPIVLPDEMMEQFDRPESLKLQAQHFSAGLFVFSLGLGKKILLADYFATFADAGFASGALTLFDAWKTALSYTFQIYFDFSGYCDMAIGLALLFNIRLPENFRSPYLATDIGDFWRKWHITLGRFLMTYVYFPLGGSRVSTFRTCCNLMITFLVSGLWHGASWLFVLWGAVHGAAQVIQRIWSKVLHCRMPLLPAKLLTFLFVCAAWVLFRAENMKQACNVYKGMFMPDQMGRLPDIKFLGMFAVAVVILIFFPTASSRVDKFRPTVINLIIALALLICSMFLFVKTSPFIYFNF
jgi:D-alanyl-lipoteichoic acid acyltransferase DltB (MBOAT superfamily)